MRSKYLTHQPNQKMSNGYSNEATYNVAIWILNDEGLYSMARRFRNKLKPYVEFCESLRECGTLETPDKVAYNDSSLDVDELNQLIEEL